MEHYKMQEVGSRSVDEVLKLEVKSEVFEVKSLFLFITALCLGGEISDMITIQ
jgi:hypothetical protein